MTPMSAVSQIEQVMPMPAKDTDMASGATAEVICFADVTQPMRLP